MTADQSRPVPRASAVDPDALDLDHLDLASWQVEAIRDRVLALVRPVEGVTIEDRYARHIHRLLWEALLPEHEYPIETRTEGEWLLAQLASRLEARS